MIYRSCERGESSELEPATTKILGREHDWGWKKFIELPRLLDGFIDDSGSLIIKAQVQVIRHI
ncbi:hypothetical protein YC2023_059904 [Brassica napus]